ncbi:MAG: Hint domain-containing protein [Pseudomonadota bacterium]
MALIANYSFSEAQGSTTAQDTGGPTVEDGTYQGGVSANGSGSANFDGVDDHVVVDADQAFAMDQGTIRIEATQETASIGNNPYGNSAAQTLFSVDSSGFDGGGHLTIFINTAGEIGVRHQTDSESHTYFGGNVTLGEPFEVTYSWGPDGSTLTVDGQVVDTGTVPLTMAGDAEPLVIGASQAQSGDGQANNLKGHFDGSIDRVQIYDTPNATLVCFVAGTRIATPTGPRRVQSLRPGDMVLTEDHGPQPIRAVSENKVSVSLQDRFDTLRPVRIRKGAVGNDHPLLVSRQHCIELDSPSGAVLVRAVHLARLAPRHARIVEPKRDRVFFHLLLDRHEVIRANGAPAETLLPNAPATLDMLPGFGCKDAPLRPCRPILSGREARARLVVPDDPALPLSVHAVAQMAAA